MTTTFRLLLIPAAAVAALAVAPRAFACGSNGYSYAGVLTRNVASGISAEITSVADFRVRHGHVAAYIGVGGPGEGPGGSNEWLQAGLSRLPTITGSDVYYEVARPGRQPAYHQVAGGVPAGKSVELRLAEISTRPNWWRVWLNGRAVSRPIYLEDSDRRWRPLATAEGFNSGSCNAFLYSVRDIRVEGGRGGGWHSLVGGYPIRSSATRLRRAHGAFLAAEGLQARRLLGSIGL